MFKKYTIIIAVMIAGALPGSSLSGQTVAGLDSTSALSDYVAYAVANNPLILSWADRHQAAREVPSQVRALPDPMLSLGVFTSSPETRVGPQQGGLMFSQKLPFFGKRSLKGDIAEREADVWGRTYDEKVLDLVRDVKKAYYDYYRVYRIFDITQKEKTVIRQMQNVAQVKYASGTVNQQDVLKAQLALSKLDDRLTRLRREMVTVTAQLNRLLNRSPDASLAPPRVGLQEIDLARPDELYDVALSRRPELAAADLGIEQAEKRYDLAKREYFPDLTLSVNYVMVDERPAPLLEDNGKDVLMFSASINVPIWLQKRRASVRESEARIAMAKHRREGLETKIKSEIRDAHSRTESAGELVRLYERVIIPQAEHTFRASEAGYQTGRVDFLNYLDSQRTLLSLRQAYFALVADLGKQHADLERTLGAGPKETGE